MPKVVHGPLGEVMKWQHLCTVSTPRLESRRNSRAVLRMRSGAAALASGSNGLEVSVQGFALLGRGT